MKAYDSVGRELMWDILGVPVNETDLSALKTDPGRLRDRRWLSIDWKKPDKECAPCWWVVNAAWLDKARQPLFACRSLVCAKMEALEHKRCVLRFCWKVS